MANVLSTTFRSYVHEAREFFSLEDVERRAGSLSEARRAELTTALPLADQRMRAADMLFGQGAYAEGLRLAKEAYASLHALADDPPQSYALLSHPLPTLDEQFEEKDRALFERMVTAYRKLRRSLVPLTLDGIARKATRKRRTGVAACALVASLGLAVFLARRPTVSVEASASYGGRYLPDNATDGLDHTHWLLPDKTLGWIDFHLSPPRKVSVVSILNGYEPSGYGLKDFRLEAWVDGKIVKTWDATFAGQAISPKPDVADVPFVVDQKVDTVRIVVKSYRDLGAGIAEVTIH